MPSPSRIIHPARRLRGDVRPPPDKSISHRALMLGALCQGQTVIRHLGQGADIQSTLAALRSVSVTISRLPPSCQGVTARHADRDVAERSLRGEDDGGGVVAVHGRGELGLSGPSSPIDCGNSGTTMRLLAGLLAGQGIGATLMGDTSLSSRPMDRVMTPLNQMGFQITARGDSGRPPLEVAAGGRCQKPFEYNSPVASAQVKSAILLAGISSRHPVRVREPWVSRDHTERLLRYLGYRCESTSNYLRPNDKPARVTLFPPHQGYVPSARPIEIPGDISAAAFFLVAAILTGSRALTLQRVGTNPTRSGLLSVLEHMGVAVRQRSRRVTASWEPVADLSLGPLPSAFSPVVIGAASVPRLIDEIPLVALLCTAALGESRISGVGELRVKESDRLAATTRLLRAVGAEVEEQEEELRIRGPTPLRSFLYDGQGDHRMVMTAVVAALVADGPCEIAGADACAVSYPSFFEDLSRVVVDQS